MRVIKARVTLVFCADQATGGNPKNQVFEMAELMNAALPGMFDNADPGIDCTAPITNVEINEFSDDEEA